MTNAKLLIDIEFAKASLERSINSMKSQIESTLSQASASKGIVSAQTKALQAQLDQVPTQKELTQEMVKTEAEIIRVNEQLLNLGRSYNQLNNAGLLNQKTVSSLSKQYEHLAGIAGIGFTNAQREVKRLAKATEQLNFDFLNLLFGGMVLERTFGGALRSIVDSFKKITGLQSEFNKATLRVSASWNFLKFAIGNALNSPFIIRGFLFISDLLEKMGDFFANNEKAALAFLAALALLALSGIIAIIASGFLQVAKVLSLMVDAAKLAVTALFTFAVTHPILTLILITLAVIAAILLSFDAYKNKIAEAWSAFTDILAIAIIALFDIFGINIDLQDAFAAIGAVGVKAFSFILLLISANVLGLIEFIAVIKSAILISVLLTGAFIFAFLKIHEFFLRLASAMTDFFGDTFMKVVSKGVTAIEKIALAMNKVLNVIGLGVDENVIKSSFDSIREEIDSLIDSSGKANNDLADGFAEAANKVKDSLSGIGTELKDTANTTVNSLETAIPQLKNLWDIANTPVVDLVDLTKEKKKTDELVSYIDMKTLQPATTEGTAFDSFFDPTPITQSVDLVKQKQQEMETSFNSLNVETGKQKINEYALENDNLRISLINAENELKNYQGTVDTVSASLGLGAGEGAGTSVTSAMDSVNQAFATNQQALTEFSGSLETTGTHIQNQTGFMNEFSTASQVDFSNFELLNSSLVDITDPLQTNTGILTGQNGFVSGMSDLNKTFSEGQIASEMTLFNDTLRQGNVLLPNHTKNIQNSSTALKELARSADTATIAIQRLLAIQNNTGQDTSIQRNNVSRAFRNEFSSKVSTLTVW